MQGFALGHLVVFVILLLVVVAGFLQQRFERTDSLDVSRCGCLQVLVVGVKGVGLVDARLAAGRLIDGVGAVDDALFTSRAILAGPTEIALPRLVGAL